MNMLACAAARAGAGRPPGYRPDWRRDQRRCDESNESELTVSDHAPNSRRLLPSRMGRGIAHPILTHIGPLPMRSDHLLGEPNGSLRVEDGRLTAGGLNGFRCLRLSLLQL
jgi:hypothetical protein